MNLFSNSRRVSCVSVYLLVEIRHAPVREGGNARAEQETQMFCGEVTHTLIE